MPKTILAIDPSIHNIGWCLWTQTEGKTGNYEGGTIEVDVFDLLLCVKLIYTRLISNLNKIKPNHVIIEQPVFMSSIKGQIAAQKGYTLDLAFIVGYLSARFSDSHVWLYTPREWKGNVPKSATEAKYKRVISSHLPSEHEIDATMMIYYHLYEK